MNDTTSTPSIQPAATPPQIPEANMEFRAKFLAHRNLPVREDLLKKWGPISIHGALIKCPQYWLNHEAGHTDRGFDLRRSYIEMLHKVVPMLQSDTDVPDTMFDDIIQGPGKGLVDHEALRQMIKLIGAVVRAERTATKAQVPVMIGKMTAIAREFDRRDLLVFNNDLTVLGNNYTIIRLRTLGKFTTPEMIVPEFIENNYLRALSALASCNGRTVRVNNILLMPGNAVMPVYWVVPCNFLKTHDTTASREIAKYISNILASFPEKSARAVRDVTAQKGLPGCSFCQFRNERNCANPKH